VTEERKKGLEGADGSLESLTGELRVAVIGAGLMGTQIGIEYALGGHAVTLCSRNQEALRERVREGFLVVDRYRLRPEKDAQTARTRIDLAAAVDDIEGADLVVESLPEDRDLKIALLGSAARCFPQATIASNTSSLSIGELGAAIGAPERTVGTHYWNPPLLMPLVELVRGELTEEPRLRRVASVLLRLGKRPIGVGDVPGFVWNRLQFALLREAVWIVENGVASAEDVDEIVQAGLARRLQLVGPFQTVALGGPGLFEAVAATLFPRLSNSDGAPNLERLCTVDPSVLGDLRSRRDSGLASALLNTADG
jgi:3-hydroxybutyryl-CoA dehydrogenase